MQPRGDLPPCKFFAENTCRKGASCPFPHVRPSGPTHSNPSGNPHSFSRRPQGGPSYKKQKPYEQGRNEGMEMDANRREEHYMGGGGGRGRVGGREGGGGFGGGGAGGGAGGGGGGSGGSGGEGRRDPRSEDFSYCKFFRQGKCTRENCKLPHTWTDKDDIKLLLAKLLRDSGQQNSELRDACLLDKLEKKFVFSFPTCLKIVSFDKNEESDVKMSPDEEITCLRYNGFLFLGVCRNNINEIKICEFGKQEQIISPAHQDFITDILLVKNYVVSCAMDGKIKFWKWDFTGNKFVLALSQGSDYELRILKYENINGTDFLFAAGTENSENAPKGALLIFNLLANENEISLQLVSQMKDYHNGEITSMLIHLIGKSPYLITGSFDTTIKFYDLYGVNPIVTLNQGSNERERSEPVTSLGIVTNNKEKDLLAAGYRNGNVILYELDNGTQAAKIIIHKPSAITNILSMKNVINDVTLSNMLISDEKGNVSFWSFEKGRG